jgi:hypothetical protein
MVTPRTGNPRGRPQKGWLQDPDRYAITLAGVLETHFRQPEERALLLAWAILNGESFPLPANLLRAARRLRLRNSTRRRLERGWVMASWETPEIGRERAIDRLRKKAKRFADNQAVARWRYYVSIAWLALLTAKGRATEEIILETMKQAGGEPFARTVMLPLLHAAFP